MEVSSMSKPSNYWEKRGWQWRCNPARGESLIFEVWRSSSIRLRDGTKHIVFEGWRVRAMVYRAHRGDRWVYQNYITGKTQGFQDLRTAMRMAVFFTLMETPNA
jgi:hypothetical protein